jgi:heptosyltransferase-2
VASAFCRPCLLRDCPIDHRCMKRVTVDQVAAALLGRLPAEAR